MYCESCIGGGDGLPLSKTGFFQFLVGDAVAQWLARWTPDKAVRVRSSSNTPIYDPSRFVLQKKSRDSFGQHQDVKR